MHIKVVLTQKWYQILLAHIDGVVGLKHDYGEGKLLSASQTKL